MEVPILNKTTGKCDMHIDGYVFDNELGIFIESKRLYSAEKLDSIRWDLEKLNRDNFESILKDLSRIKPNNIFSFIIAEAWSENILKWWNNGTGDNERWDRKSFLIGYEIGSIKVYHYKDFKYDNCLYWLYAYTQII